jgi:phospholipid/cholesterol/gamma-HCH transport system substrate-binding protein
MKLTNPFSPWTPFKERNPIVVGSVGALIMVVLAGATFFSDDLPIIGGGVTYTAEFSEAAGLKDKDEVRVAGVKVGEVTDVALAGDHVVVSFKIKGTWLGDRTTADIKIKTLLGQKNLVLDPLGTKDLDPGTPIPLSRTQAPYDVTAAFNDLATTVGSINTGQLAQSFQVLSQTLGASTPDEVRTALTGMSALSQTLASRDDQLTQLFTNTSKISTTLGDRTAQIQSLITNGNTILTELNNRKDAIAKLFGGTQALAVQLKGLVADNQSTLGPALDQLDRVATVLQGDQDKLNESLRLAGPFYRLLGNTLGNGHWIDTYICGLIPTGGPAGSCQPSKAGGR